MKTLKQILEETIPEIDIMAGDWQKDRSAKDKILDEIIRKFANELPQEKKEPPIAELMEHHQNCQCYRNRAGFNQCLKEIKNLIQNL